MGTGASRQARLCDRRYACRSRHGRVRWKRRCSSLFLTGDMPLEEQLVAFHSEQFNFENRKFSFGIIKFQNFFFC